MCLVWKVSARLLPKAFIGLGASWAYTISYFPSMRTLAFHVGSVAALP